MTNAEDRERGPSPSEDPGASGDLHPHYAEVFRLLFRMENCLRVFVYGVLKAAYGGEWDKQSFGTGDTQTSISKLARQREAQQAVRGYVGKKARCPLMHLTLGELSGTILAANSYTRRSASG